MHIHIPLEERLKAKEVNGCGFQKQQLGYLRRRFRLLAVLAMLMQPMVVGNKIGDVTALSSGS
jgi:hypothetical protein